MSNSIRILVMEDDRGLARLVQKRLERAGYFVDLAFDGEEGLALYAQEPYDLVAVDQKMPAHDGLEVIRILAAKGPLPPTIMVTGSGDEKTAVKAMQLGASDYVVKDVAGVYLDLLPSVIEGALIRQRLVKEKEQAEAELKRSEVFSRTVLDAMNSNIAVLDGKGNITAVNRAWECFARENGEPSLAKTSVDANYLEVCRSVSGDDAGLAQEALRGIQAVLDGSRQFFDMEYPCHSPAEERWFLLHAAPMPGSYGGAVLSHLNITERKQAEEELRTRQQELTVRNRISDIFLRISDEEMFGAVLQFVLEAMKSMYGVFGYVDEEGNEVCPSMTRDIWEQCRVPDKEIIFPREKWCGIWGQALKEKRPIKSNGPFQVPEGHIPVHRAFAMPIIHQEEAIGLLHVANKATDYDERDEKLLKTMAEHIAPVLHARLLKERQEKKREQAEKMLKAREERYRLLAETMGEGLVIQDKKNLVTFVNTRFCQMMGFAHDECIGRPLAALLGVADDLLFDLVAGRGEDDSLSFEKTVKRKGGREICLSISVQLLLDAEGECKGSFALFTDITELRALRQRVDMEEGFEGMIGRDAIMLELFDTIRKVAVHDFPVFIKGESGTGKELVAQALHNVSPKSAERFVPVHCGALPEGLLESELFGHVKGAFTGAIRDKKGRFELADGGTIFFDEIGELSPAIQVKLLRVLQEGTFERVGGEATMKTDVRIISATNKDLQKEVAAGRFREDLFYRLCVIPITTPPLRERRGDIALLAKHYLNVETKNSPHKAVFFSSEALQLLTGYTWPGNVRELQNVVRFAFLKSQGNTIEPVHLPANLLSISESTYTKKSTKRKIDAQAIAEALEKADGNKVEAAKILGISRATLYRVLADEQQAQ